MKQISKRIAYLFSLRRKRISDVLKKYDLQEYEYYLLIELSYTKEIAFEDLKQVQRLPANILNDLISSLKKKDYISIQDETLLLTDKFIKINDYINRDLKRIDDDISEKIDHHEYNQYIHMLDELIDYYDE